MNNNKFKNLLGRRISVKEVKKTDSTGTYTAVYDDENGNKINVYVLSENTDNLIITAVIYNTKDNTEKLVVTDNDTVIYEPYIKAVTEDNKNCIYYCLYEKTCGSIVYTIKDNNTKYFLLVLNDSGHIGFPKGHIEYGESEAQTAIREVFEETGLNISIDENTRQEYTYTNTSGVIKNCVYFCSEFKDESIKIQQEEIEKSWLVPYDEAYQLLNYPQDRIIFEKAVNIND